MIVIFGALNGLATGWFLADTVICYGKKQYGEAAMSFGIFLVGTATAFLTILIKAHL